MQIPEFFENEAWKVCPLYFYLRPSSNDVYDYDYYVHVLLLHIITDPSGSNLVRTSAYLTLLPTVTICSANVLLTSRN